MSLFIVLLQIFRVVVIQPCEFKTRHLRKQQGNLQFCYNFSSVLSQVKGLPVAKSHKKILFFKCSSTPERKVPQRSDASQNDHKSKGHPSKTSEAAFTMQKADLVMQLAFWQTCQNAIKCHEMTKCLHFGSGSCIRIFF